jgi:hypothetical protein
MKAMKATARLLVLGTLLPAVLAVGCKKNDTPVGKLEVAPVELKLAPSEVQKVQLTWTPSVALGAEGATVFVHLLDSEKKVVRTYDHAFPQAWAPGTPVSYDVKVFQSAIAPPLAAGKYTLTVGLYGKDGERWALEGMGEPVGKKEYKAADVDVAPDGYGPKFAFAPAWGPLEEGGDRQVVARRWMVNRGSIRLNDQRDAGTVWLVVRIPEERVEGYELVFDPTATTPMVKAIGRCGSTEMSVSGPGLHEIELPVEAPVAGDYCSILLTANYQLKPTSQAGTPRSASLENIAWIDGTPSKGSASDPNTAPAVPADAADSADATAGKDAHK